MKIPNFFKSFLPKDEQQRKDPVIAIDIGTSKTKILVGERGPKGDMCIIRAGEVDSLGVKKGKVNNTKNAAQSIKKAFLEIVEEKDFATLSKFDLYMALSGGFIECNRVEVSHIIGNFGGVFSISDAMSLAEKREVTEVDISELKGNAVKEIMRMDKIPIHAFPQEFVVDEEGGIKEEEVVGVNGHKISSAYNVITCDSDATKNIEKILKHNNLEQSPQYLLQHFATAEAILTETDKEMGTALIDIGAGKTNIIIYKDGILRHISVILKGSDELTREIQYVFRMPLEQAEDIKIRGASAIRREEDINQYITVNEPDKRTSSEKSKANIAIVVHARLMDILEEIQQDINNAGYNMHDLSSIVLTGGCAQLPDIKTLCDEVFAIDTRIGQPVVPYTFGADITEEEREKMQSQPFSTVLGMLKFALEKKEFEKENTEVLIHNEQNQKNSSYRKNKFFSKYIDPVKKTIEGLLDDSGKDAFEQR